MLKIDLLPARVLRARSNRVTLVLLGFVLALVVAVLAFVFLGAKQRVAAARGELETITQVASELDKVQADTSNYSGRLKPIADKIAFIAQADECGNPYWDRFYEVNEYIYGQAQVLAFGIAAEKAAPGPIGDGSPEALYNLSGPGSNTDCGFLVYMKDARDLARFILNMIRCPVLTDIRFTGISNSALFDIGSGLSIRQDMAALAPPGAASASTQPQGMGAGAGRAGAGPGMGGGGGMAGGPPGGGLSPGSAMSGPSGMGGPGGMSGPGGMGGPGGMAGPGGGAGMGGPGGMAGGGPGMAGGGMGGPGAAMGAGGRGAGAGQAASSSYSVGLPPVQVGLARPVALAVTGKLVRPIRVPQPPAGGAAAGAAAGGPGGMMGAPGGMGGGMPSGVSGSMMPGGMGGGAPGGGTAGAPAAGGAKGGASKGDDSGGGAKAAKKGDSGDE